MRKAKRQERRALKKELISNATFRGLGVLVAGGRVYRNEPFTWPDDLGPVKGARAVVTTARVHRVGAGVDAAILAGPAGMALALSRKTRAQTVVATSTGEAIVHTVEGGSLIRDSQAKAVTFNVIAESSD